MRHELHSLKILSLILIGAVLCMVPMIGRATDTLSYSLSVSEPVNVSGTPRLLLDIGGQSRYATYNAGASTSTTLVFSYSVTASDIGPVSLTSTLDANGGNIVDTVGNPLIQTFAAPSTPGVLAGIPPANTASPTVTGITYPGKTLTCLPGTWEGTPTFTYQWNLNGSPLLGATAPTHVVDPAEEGGSFICTVTALNPLGTVDAQSAAVDNWVPADINNILGVYTTARADLIELNGNRVESISCGAEVGQPLTQASPAAQPTFDLVARTIIFDGINDILLGSQTESLSGNEAVWLAHFGAFHGASVSAAEHAGGINTGTSTGGQSMSMTGAFAATDGVVTARLFNGGVSSETSQSPGQDFGVLLQYQGTTHAGMTIWRDGTPATAVANNPASIMAFTGSMRFVLGATMNNGAYGAWSRWRSRAMIMGRGVLAQDDIDRLFGWWAWQFDQQAALPAGHPYKDAAP